MNGNIYLDAPIIINDTNGKEYSSRELCQTNVFKNSNISYHNITIKINPQPYTFGSVRLLDIIWEKSFVQEGKGRSTLQSP